MLVVGTFLLQNISAYYYNDFSNSLNNQVFTENFVSDLETAASGTDAMQKLPELLDIYSSRIGIDSFRNYYILDTSLRVLGGTDNTFSH